MSGMGSISDDDRSLVIRCLGEALEGEYFPDWEFETLMGFTRSELREFLDAAKSSRALESLPDMRPVVGSVLNNRAVSRKLSPESLLSVQKT
jgi:hypothetical protein